MAEVFQYIPLNSFLVYHSKYALLGGAYLLSTGINFVRHNFYYSNLTT